MADAIQTRSKRRRKHLKISLEWGMQFGVNANALREAIYAVGTEPARIETYLMVLKARRLERSPRHADA